MSMMLNEIGLVVSLQTVLGATSLTLLSRWCASYLIFSYPLFALVLGKGGAAKSLASRLTQQVAVEASLASALAFGAAYLIGEWIQRLRPFQASGDVARLISEPLTRFSLPSGHASVAFAVACSIAYANPRFGLAAFIIACLVSFGRVAAGVHYPTDVLAGAVLGVASWVVIRYLLLR